LWLGLYAASGQCPGTGCDTICSSGAPCNLVPLKNPRPAVIIEVFPKEHPNIHRVHSGMPCEDEANKLHRCCKRVDSLTSLSEEEHRITAIRLGLDDCCHLFETTEEGCILHGRELEMPKAVSFESRHGCHWETHSSDCDESSSSEGHSSEHESHSSSDDHHDKQDDDDDDESDDKEDEQKHNSKDDDDDDDDDDKSHSSGSHGASSASSKEHDESNSTHSDAPSAESLAKTAQGLEERIESLEEKLNSSSRSVDELTSTAKELTKAVVEATALVNNAEAKDARIQAELKHIALHNAEQLVQLHSEIEHFTEEHKEASLKSSVNAARLSDLEARLGRLEAEHK